MERLGAAPNSEEMRQIAPGHPESQGVGRNRLSLRQCPNCLCATPLTSKVCPRCSKPMPETDR